MKYIFLLVFLPFLSFGTKGDIEITLVSNKSSVSLGEPFLLSLKIERRGRDASKLQVEVYKLPVFFNSNDFHIMEQLSGETSSFQSLFNRDMHFTKTVFVNYHLQAKRVGLLKIGPIKFNVEGGEIQSNQLSIRVEKNPNTSPSAPPSVSPSPALPPTSPPSAPLSPSMPPSNPPSAPPSIPSSPPSPFSNMFPFNNKGFFNPFDKGPFFARPQEKRGSIQTDLSLNEGQKRSFYKGEGFRADWIILQSSSQFMGWTIHPPSLQGFYREVVEVSPRNSFMGTELRNNTLYQKHKVLSLWLFPLKEGRLQIPSIQTEPRIAPFSFDKGVLFFPKKEITVKELPPVGRNSRWTGAVGDFKVRAEIQEQNITAQEPFFYKIIFEGKGGHPLFIRLPPISFPPSLKSHPPVDKSSFDPSSGQGKKEFEIPLIPKTAGSLTIPSFSFQFFDPTKEKYINLRTKKFFLFVQRRPAEKTDGGGQAKDPTLIDPRKEAQGDLKTEEKEISEAKKAKGFSKSAYWPTFLSHINLSLFWPMFFVFCFLFTLYMMAVKSSENKKQMAKSQMRKKIKTIKKLLDQKDWKSACEKMIQALYFALLQAQDEKTQTSLSLDRKQAEESLSPHLKTKYAGQFEFLFKHLETLSFAKKKSGSSDEKALKHALLLFQKLKTLSRAFLKDLP